MEKPQRAREASDPRLLYSLFENVERSGMLDGRVKVG